MKNLNKNITNEKNLKYIVYITTNLINYKKYIGSHVCKDLNDGYLGSGTSLIQALKKYSSYWRVCKRKETNNLWL